MITKELSERDMCLCLAVLIESEGSLQIFRVHKSYQAKISIAMVTCEWIAKCWQFFNIGRLYKIKKEGKKVQYLWAIQKASEVKKLLTMLLPYFHEKKDQAELLLEFIEFQETTSKGGGRKNPIEYRLQGEKYLKRSQDLHNTSEDYHRLVYEHHCGDDGNPRQRQLSLFLNE